MKEERKNEIPVTGTQLAIAERLARQLHEIDKQKRKEELSVKFFSKHIKFKNLEIKGEKKKRH